MNILRSKKFQKHLNNIDEWTEKNVKIEKLFNYSNNIHIADSIWNDIEVEEWLDTYLDLDTEKQFSNSIIKNPIINTKELYKRQKVLKFFSNKKHNILLDNKIEQTLCWFQETPNLEKNYLYNILFPNSWYMKWIKYEPNIFKLYHYYNCYINPMTNLAYPLSTLLGPYWVLTKKLKFKMSFIQYINNIKYILNIIRSQSKDYIQWYKFVIVASVYIILYLYSLAQIIDLSIQLHNFRVKLLNKIKVLYLLQKSLKNKLKTYNYYEFWKIYEPNIKLQDIMFNFKPNLYWLNKIMQNKVLQQNIKYLHKVSVIHDVMIKTNSLLGKYCFSKYGDITYIGNMKNPMLEEEQISNPICLKTNLIISGPNAGGKTTYVKSFIWNILLSQSLGIIYGSYGTIKPYDAILHHHRITDITGDTSLFQAEMKKIKETINCLDKYSNIAYFLDEPLHSTHPIDGASMLKALLYYIGSKNNIKVLVTSHYFSIQTIEEELRNYKNISVKAIIDNDDIIFDYKIYKGSSIQTIGIELLRKDKFPKNILDNAIKLKNKLYQQKINV